jgi:hypothetical protein
VNLFFIASDIPRKPHDTRAPNVVVNEAIEAFAELGHHVTLQLLFGDNRRALQDDETAQLDRLKTQHGIEILAPLWKDDIPKNPLEKVLKPLGLNRESSALYPFAGLGKTIANRVSAAKAQAVFSLWSQPALAACASLKGVCKAIYYGNPDYKPAETRLISPTLFDQPSRNNEELRKELGALEKKRTLFFDLIKKYDLIWNVCAVDAQLIRDGGAPQSSYMQNMWPLPAIGNALEIRRDREQLKPLKICANLGGLQGTANTYGLHFIGAELAPALAADEDMKTAELHVFGARKPSAAVAKVLQHPQVIVRGFVEDIDAEVLSCPVFLLANNCGHYKAGHTRFLHAWSLQSCIIAHRNNLETMPELVHGENVLLAANAEEFIKCIKLAAGDRALRERIGKNGYDLFTSRFAPKVVTGKLAAQIVEAIAK